jgi:hypothetical protein
MGDQNERRKIKRKEREKSKHEKMSSSTISCGSSVASIDYPDEPDSDNSDESDNFQMYDWESPGAIGCNPNTHGHDYTSLDSPPSSMSTHRDWRPIALTSLAQDVHTIDDIMEPVDCDCCFESCIPLGVALNEVNMETAERSVGFRIRLDDNIAISCGSHFVCVRCIRATFDEDPECTACPAMHGCEHVYGPSIRWLMEPNECRKPMSWPCPGCTQPLDMHQSIPNATAATATTRVSCGHCGTHSCTGCRATECDVRGCSRAFEYSNSIPHLQRHKVTIEHVLSRAAAIYSNCGLSVPCGHCGVELQRHQGCKTLTHCGLEVCSECGTYRPTRTCCKGTAEMAPANRAAGRLILQICRLLGDTPTELCSLVTKQMWHCKTRALPNR